MANCEAGGLLLQYTILSSAFFYLYKIRILAKNMAVLCRQRKNICFDPLGIITCNTPVGG